MLEGFFSVLLDTRRAGEASATPALNTEMPVESFSLLIRLRGIAQIGLHNLEAFGEQRLGFGVIHSRSDDAIFSIFPISRRRNLKFRGQLKRVHDSHEFIKISPA
jgi:hypothetical protein